MWQEVMVDLMEVMKENKIMMPHGLTMLARGLTHVEGVLAEICPEINMTQIAAARLKEQLFSNGNWKREIKKKEKSCLVPETCSGYSLSGSRFPSRLYERADEDQSGSSCLG